MKEETKRDLFEYRLHRLHIDLAYLSKKKYNIISVSEEALQIVISGCLFDFCNLHALYISPYYDKRGHITLQY